MMIGDDEIETQAAGGFQATFGRYPAIQRHCRQAGPLQSQKKGKPFRAVGQTKGDPVARVKWLKLAGEMGARFRERLCRP